MRVLGTDPVWGAVLGEVTLSNIHSSVLCEGEYCVIHNPSEHHMRSWKMLWRADKSVMERICPHGIGHPDPDDLSYHVRNGRASAGLHGCDGCCYES